MKSVFYVGMGVHKDSVRIAVLKGTEKQTVYAIFLQKILGVNRHVPWFVPVISVSLGREIFNFLLTI
jgi:hypothetical protein